VALRRRPALRAAGGRATLEANERPAREPANQQAGEASMGRRVGRRVAAAIAAVAVLGLTGPAVAQTFPAKPVTLIVPWPAGGSTDLVLRSLANASQKHLGQSIVIENRPGAGGALAPVQMAATAAPDGYTVAQAPITVFRFPFLQKTSFDPVNDLSYVIGLTGYTFGMVVRSDARWKTFQELIAEARANPGKITYGSPGAGTSLHIGMEQIARLQGVKWTHVPFKGGAEVINALLGGHIDIDADSTSWAPQVNAGQFRLLATWGAERTRNWPSVPTLKEIGINLVSNSPFGLVGPKGMDPKVVAVLHDAFRKGMEEASYRAEMAKFDQEAFYMTSADYRAYAVQTLAEQKQIMGELGLRKD
jgi:tripartite-type tricarboxylate transporter receptor subunit TctC